MKVILLEKIDSLGNLGDEVMVKPGFARNYLFPKYKAVLSNKKNLLFFQDKIKEIEMKNELNNKETEEKKKKIEDIKLEIKVKSSEKGKLFGSITSKHIIQIFEKNGVKLEKSEIIIQDVINKLGNHDININLKNNIKIKKDLLVIKEE